MKETKFRPVPIEHEPKRDNRFIVEFPESFGIVPYVIQSITRPKINNGKWEDFEITLIDIIGPSTTNAIMDLIEYCNENKPGFFSKKKSIFNFTIKSLDPTGVEVERWNISVNKLVYVDFGNCSYKSDGLQMIKVVLEPLDCKLI